MPANAACSAPCRPAEHLVARPPHRLAGRLIGVLDGERYLALLDALDALLADPPLRGGRRPAGRRGDPPAVRGRRTARRPRRAGPGRPPGTTATSPCTRPARTPSGPATPPRPPAPRSARPAKAFAGLDEGGPELLGDHQDSVVARDDALHPGRPGARPASQETTRTTPWSFSLLLAGSFMWLFDIQLPPGTIWEKLRRMWLQGFFTAFLPLNLLYRSGTAVGMIIGALPGWGRSSLFR